MTMTAKQIEIFVHLGISGIPRKMPGEYPCWGYRCVVWVRFFSGLEKSMIFGSKVCPLSCVSRLIYTSTSSHLVGFSCLVAYWCQKEEQRTETLLRKLYMVRKRHFSLYFFGISDFSGRNVKIFSAAGSPFQNFHPRGKDAINDALSIPQGWSA